MPNEGTALYPYLSFRFAVIYPFTAGCTLVVPASESPSSVDIMQIIQEERCKAIGVLFVKDCHGLFHSPHLGDYDLSSLDRASEDQRPSRLRVESETPWRAAVVAAPMRKE
ncbi:hypothetical protein Bbelb_019510 [Branchiostoma belcheri]|nr:hypothetical protein Bbelb_019510 [Branchiostoma belcheri]